MTDDELSVLTANETFYQAFATQDYAGMDALWAHGKPATCIHPGWSALVGRGAVMASWRAILRAEGMGIESSAARATIAGDAAYVLCFEGPRGEPPTLIATNIFVREDGRWRLLHHHAGPLARPPETVASGPSN